MRESRTWTITGRSASQNCEAVFRQCSPLSGEDGRTVRVRKQEGWRKRKRDDTGLRLPALAYNHYHDDSLTEIRSADTAEFAQCPGSCTSAAGILTEADCSTRSMIGMAGMRCGPQAWRQHEETLMDRSGTTRRPEPACKKEMNRAANASN